MAKAISRIFGFGKMALRRTSPDVTEGERSDQVPDSGAAATEKAPRTVADAKQRFGLEPERGLNLKSEGEPSGPMDLHVGVKKHRTGRFARIAVDAADGRQPDADLR